MSITPFFSGEVQLAGWNESHNSGSKVSFWLPDSKDLDPFRTATIRKGNKAGQRFACVLVEIGDDEQLVQPYEPITVGGCDGGADLVPFVDKPKGGELAKWAGILSNDPLFWDYTDTDNANEAAAFIRQNCSVPSRADLDHNDGAARIFRKIMGAFSEWKDGGRAA